MNVLTRDNLIIYTPRLIAKEEYGKLDIADKDLFDTIIRKTTDSEKEKNASFIVIAKSRKSAKRK